MSHRSPSRIAGRRRAQAPVFGALGDETRLALVARLSVGRPCSIAELTGGSRLTRQAITKHLRVLEGAGIVHSARSGREKRFAFVLRDAHQSLMATRMAMEDMVPACADLDKAGFWSVECWGGATFDSCIRFLNEDPWERLRSSAS
jgi:DNA-binding transcriptional ArsR family regulator